MSTWGNPNSPTQVKGIVVRGYLQALDKLGWRSVVESKVSAATKAVMRDPPLGTAWVDMCFIEEMVETVYSVHGADGVRKASKESVMIGVLPILRSVVEGFLRLFGTSPATLFSRMNQFSANTVKGVQYEWVQNSPNSGVMYASYTRTQKVSHAIFIGGGGSLEATLDLCRVKGTVSEPVYVPDRPGQCAKYNVSWE